MRTKRSHASPAATLTSWLVIPCSPSSAPLHFFLMYLFSDYEVVQEQSSRATLACMFFPLNYYRDP